MQVLSEAEVLRFGGLPPTDSAVPVRNDGGPGPVEQALMVVLGGCAGRFVLGRLRRRPVAS